MIKKILGTAGSRLIITIISFAVVIINAQNLGAGGVGEITLVVLGITIILLISNVVGGGALVYLIPRFDLFKILVPAYFWSFLSAIIGAYTLSFFDLIPRIYTHHVLFLSLFQSLASTNLNVLLGKEKIKQFNFISVFQVIALIGSLIFFFFYLKHVEVISYIYAMYLAYFSSFLISAFTIRKYVRFKDFEQFDEAIIQIFKYGTYVQLANLMQLLNYRLGYYIIERFLGKPSLGVFSVGNQVSEGLWLIGKSVAMVQYSRISNSTDAIFAKNITLRFLKFVFVITFGLLAILIIIPDSFFVFVFTKDFSGLHRIILSLSPGILAMSVSMILSHFYSGTGRHYHNTISSGIGLVLTLIFGFTLIPEFGILGAGITASISYFASASYQLIVFMKITKTSARNFLLSGDDISFIKNEISEIIKRKN